MYDQCLLRSVGIKASKGEQEDQRRVQDESKSIGEGARVRERHRCYLLIS